MENKSKLTVAYELVARLRDALRSAEASLDDVRERGADGLPVATLEERRALCRELQQKLDLAEIELRVMSNTPGNFVSWKQECETRTNIVADHKSECIRLHYLGLRLRTEWLAAHRSICVEYPGCGDPWWNPTPEEKIEFRKRRRACNDLRSQLDKVERKLKDLIQCPPEEPPRRIREGTSF